MGVANNKVFAKLGSDMKKPDATTVLFPSQYRQKVWRLPVGELLYIGPATTRKLYNLGLYTIGDLAQADAALLSGLLGKWGLTLHRYANGLDASPVARDGARDPRAEHRQLHHHAPGPDHLPGGADHPYRPCANPWPPGCGRAAFAPERYSWACATSSSSG